MSKALKFAGLVLTGALLGAPAAMFAQGPPPPPPGGYYQQPGNYQGGWDAPPGSYRNDLQRAAFHDGLYGGEQDLKNHRPPNVNNRDEFRNYRGPNRRAYRQAFQAGYRAFWNHYRGGRGYPGY